MHYTRFYSKTVTGITPQQIWAIWSDINQRHVWDDDTEWAKITGEFVAGNTFTFKPVGGPKLTMHITECTVNRSFTDCYHFPFAKLYGIHEIIELNQGLEIKTTIVVEGLLTYLWRKLVAEKIVDSLPHQTELLIQAAKKVVI